MTTVATRPARTTAAAAPAGGLASAGAAWPRVDLRRRWRSLVVLALLVAVSTGLVFTAPAVPVYFVAPLATAAVLLTVLVALLLAALLAAWPGRRAARLHLADALRAE
jgi:hypothetical protein